MSNQKPKAIKAWAVTWKKGKLLRAWNFSHSIFAPRIYSSKKDAEKVVDVLKTGSNIFKVIPVLITPL